MAAQVMTAEPTRSAEFAVAEMEPRVDRVRDGWRAVWDGEATPLAAFDAKLEYYYQRNPAGPVHVLQMTAAPKSEVIGMVSLSPRQFWVDGEACTFAMPCDFVVRRDYRFALPALVLQRRAQALALEQFSGTYSLPGVRAAPIFKRLGGLEEITRIRWVRVFDHSDVLQAHVGRPAAGVLGGLLDAFARCHDALRFGRGSRRWRTAWVESFDERFDTLWRQSDRRGLAIGDRSGQFLSWRFAKVLAPGRRTLVVVRDGATEISAYVIGVVRAQTFHIDDLFADLGDPRLGEVLHAALAELRHSGVARVSMRLVAPRRLTRALAQVGFRQREADIAFINASPATRSRTAACEFYLTSADEDT
jgi:hypothetical protein